MIDDFPFPTFKAFSTQDFVNNTEVTLKQKLPIIRKEQEALDKE